MIVRNRFRFCSKSAASAPSLPLLKHWVQMTHLEVSLPWNDISFSLPRKLSTPNRQGILQMSLKMQLTGCSRRHDGSEWFNWHTLTLSCLDMTSYSQLIVANLGTNCLPLLGDWSFKYLQRCSWRAVLGAMTALNGSKDIPWHCFALIQPPIFS